MIAPERWARVRTLLEELGSLGPDERRAALAHVQDADIALEVEALLHACDQAGAGFLEPFPLRSPEAQPLQDASSLADGTHLGNFRIEALIGAGGMGQVYRARDLRLDRTVAIKILPGHLAGNAANREWFEREARAISRLAHPHVCVLHDVGRATADDGIERLFMVMELIDGSTLTDRLAHGALSIDETIRYATQIAEALAAAHAQNIVHFDLKPSNIMLSRSGVKLLDFGLARLRTPVAAGDPAAVTPGDDTMPGIVGGTLPYMSPEQLRGGHADWRSDLFAFGAVVYEMLAGRRAFAAATAVELTEAILEAEPPPLQRRDGPVPPALEALVRTCLAKAPDDRWQSAHDIALQLTSVAPRRDGERQDTRRSPRATAAVWASGGALAVAIVALAIAAARPATEPRPVPQRLMFDATPVLAGQMFSPVISRDDRSIGFVTKPTTGSYQFFVRQLDTGETRELAGFPGGWGGDWSADGSQFVTMSLGLLTATDPRTGHVTELARLPADLSTIYGGVSESTAGTVIVGGPALQRLVRGRTLEPLYRSRAGIALQIWPCFLPNGREFVFTQAAADREQRGVFLGSLDSEHVQRLLPDFTNAVITAGVVLFAREGALMAQRFDDRRRSLIGEPIAVAPDILVSQSFAHFAARGGNLLAYIANDPPAGTELVWYDRSGRRGAVVGVPAQYRQIALAPDGRRLALERLDEIWLLDLASGNSQRVNASMHKDDAFGGAVDVAWNPDGTRLMFTGWTDGEADLFTVGLDPQGRASPLPPLPRMQWSEQWSPDGRMVLFAQTDSPTKTSLWALGLDGTSAAVPLVDTPYINDEPQLSPDQHWLAYISDETGRMDVYLQPFNRPGSRLTLSPAGGGQPKWRADGRELFYMAPDGAIMSVPFNGRGEPGRAQRLFQTPLQPTLFLDEYAVTPDGQRFIVLSPARTGPSARMMIVSNWRNAESLIPTR